MFGNICYYFETQKMNFTDAQTSCKTKFGSSGGKLFEPKDLATHNAVREKQVEEVTKLGGNNRFYKTWLGISDRGHEGTFTFVSDEAHLPFTAWNKQQPSDPGSSNYDCVIIYDFLPEDKNYRNDHWADVRCRSNFFSICEQQSFISDTSSGIFTSANKWFLQNKDPNNQGPTLPQYTKCASVENNGKTCRNPEVRYGSFVLVSH